MNSKMKSKVAIIGAGSVGASAAFAMTLKHTVSELVLIDVNKEKATGEVADINHGLSFLGMMDIYAGDYTDVKDCDVIVITAGQNRKPGETRLDLAKKNISLAKIMTESIMEHYNGGTILVVSNPVDIMTLAVQKWSGLPHGRVLGSGTTLDSSRFRYDISKKLDIDVRNVHGYIIGEHGDSQIPCWSATHLAGMNLDEYCKEHNITLDKEEIATQVRTAGAQVIAAKGVTNYAIGTVISSLVETLVNNQNTIRTVSSVINGMYGINDVALSLPSMINGDGVYDYLKLDLTDVERKALQDSAASIRTIIDSLDMGL